MNRIKILLRPILGFAAAARPSLEALRSDLALEPTEERYFNEVIDALKKLEKYGNLLLTIDRS